MDTRIFIAASIASFFTPVMSLLAYGEHPGPPPQPQIQLPQAVNQPQSAARTMQTQQISRADISSGIKRHIASNAKQSKDRKFHVKYGSKDLALDLVKVHDDRLANLGGDKYFACVDMKGSDGTLYDIDFFMNGNPSNVTETSVHKINGKPLYNWKEQGGIWKKTRA
jgi:hypothetical protein